MAATAAAWPASCKAASPRSSRLWAFAALKSDGSVVTWGDSDYGGDSSSVAAELESGVSQIFSTWAFAALKSDGSVVTWGDYPAGAATAAAWPTSLQSGVSQIFSTGYAFAALKSDGSVVTWGNSGNGAATAAAWPASAKRRLPDLLDTIGPSPR
jgi:hypothetical protein